MDRLRWRCQRFPTDSSTALSPMTVYTPYVDLLAEDADDEVTLTVYDRTASLDEIAVTSYSMVIPVVDAANGIIGVLAAVNLTNSGDEVYLADLTDPRSDWFQPAQIQPPGRLPRT